MVTQVTLGNFFTLSNGKSVLGGAGGSGLDTQSIITSLVAAKSQPATNDQDQIKVNNAQSSALTNFQSLLSTFQSAADALSNPPGVGNEADNVFDFTNSSISNGGSSYFSVTASPGAALQSYNVSNISSLATAAQQTTGIFTVASADAAVASANPISGTSVQFAPGTITVNGQTITINEGDSLNTIAADFNAVQSSTGIAATVIQVSSNQYELSFNATQTGSANGFDLTSSSTVSDPDGVLSNIGLTDSRSTATFTVASADVTVTSNSDIADGPGGTGYQFTPGNYTINGQTVTINPTDSLNQVAVDFNSVSGTGITAHVVQVGTGEYQLAFTANGGATGTGLADLSSVTGVGISSTKAGTGVTAGTDAQFDINGIPITRSSNSISDVVNGVTFNLLQQTPGDDDTVYTASVQPDTTTIQNSIVSFVNAYNAIQTFAAQQTQLNSNGTYASSAVLANNQTFRQIMSDLNQEVVSQVSGLSGSITSLSDVGITFTNQPATSTTPAVNNILTVDDGELTSALSSNFSAVKNLFGLNMTSNNPDLALYSANNALTASGFTLNIDPTDNIYTATYDPGTGPVTVNLTATAIGNGVPGYTLTGQSGTALDGLVLIYASNSAATINVTTTQGVAAVMNNTANTAITANTGSLAVALQEIQTNNTTLNNDITQINTQVQQYQTQLVNQYAALESAISNVNTLLDSLNANSEAQLEAANVP